MAPVNYHYDKFPPKRIDWEKLIPYIGPSNAAIARYDGVLSVIQNQSLLLSPLSTQDAVLSSKIEGTQATMGEVLEYEAGGDPNRFTPERKIDIQEILNYRKAMLTALDLLRELPICERLVKATHRVLLDSVRGQNRTPGEFRRIPVWIGPKNCPLEEADFIPIDSIKISGAISAWEKYINGREKDILVQLAVLHAEFEAIHPFLDGNGRLGRILIPLFLFNIRIIQSPMFYISAYFERNREEYYERLRNISKNDDWTGWCIFFLKAVETQAEENSGKVMKILNLYDELKRDVPEMTHSQYAIRALDWIFAQPIFKSSDFIDDAKIPQATARRILDVLRQKKIIKILTKASGRRAGIYLIPSLLNIAEGYKAF